MKTSTVYDVIVLGSGIAGLSFANYFLEAQSSKPENNRLSLLVVSKGDAAQTNTAWAQGGIAAPINDNDSFDQHIEDTIVAGSYANDISITEKIIQQAPKAINDLLKWGVEFDRKEDGDFDLGLEGGHSQPRILHHQDITGSAIQAGLINHFFSLGGTVRDHFIAVNVKRESGGYVILFFDKINNSFHTIACSQFIMATGGIGQLFEHTTNTRFSSGDGIYFAQQLGATIRDLAFVQFHPTGLYTTDGQDFLISEALRGAGARLLNHDFIPFMLSYDQRGDLAPRDIVSRAIWQEMKLVDQPYVYLDATHIPVEQLNQHFSHLIEGCLKRTGIDLRKDPIPVMPIQHYSCGGIWTDEFGASSLDNLYAIGECASTGLHGANRLASNSLLEGICMADFAANHSLMLNGDSKFHPTQSTIDTPLVYELDHKQIKNIFSRAAGVVRKKSSLKEAFDQLQHIKLNAKEIAFNIEAFENTVALNLSILLLKDAQSKDVSIGVHYIEESS
jgi:L-aspartate oxidase